APAPVSAPVEANASPEKPTWEQEREAVFEAIVALRMLCETLYDRLAELRHAQTREFGMLGAWRSLKQWKHDARRHIEETSQKQEKELLAPPPLHSLRQT